jgi:hypothetical protein
VVQVSVVVRNKALVDARNVWVTLWRGSPDNCLDEACLLDDNTLICTEEVALVPAQGKREVWFLFRYDGVQNIHATSETDEGGDMHAGNNHAYALLFNNIVAHGYTLQNLRLDPTIELEAVTESGRGYTTGYNVTATLAERLVHAGQRAAVARRCGRGGSADRDRAGAARDGLDDGQPVRGDGFGATTNRRLLGQQERVRRVRRRRVVVAPAATAWRCRARWWTPAACATATDRRAACPSRRKPSGTLCGWTSTASTAAARSRHRRGGGRVW